MFGYRCTFATDRNTITSFTFTSELGDFEDAVGIALNEIARMADAALADLEAFSLIRIGASNPPYGAENHELN